MREAREGWDQNCLLRTLRLSSAVEGLAVGDGV